MHGGHGIITNGRGWLARERPLYTRQRYYRRYGRYGDMWLGIYMKSALHKGKMTDCCRLICKLHLRLYPVFTESNISESAVAVSNYAETLNCELRPNRNWAEIGILKVSAPKP